MDTVGYLEESAGVKSSTRALAVGFYGLTALTVLVMIGYVGVCLFVMGQQPTGPVLYGFGAVITALGGSGAYTQGKRT